MNATLPQTESSLELLCCLHRLLREMDRGPGRSVPSAQRLCCPMIELNRQGMWSSRRQRDHTGRHPEREGSDLIDPRTKRLVWEAVGVGRITDDTFENLEQKVAEGVPRYFELFPFRAGDGTPHEASK